MDALFALATLCNPFVIEVLTAVAVRSSATVGGLFARLHVRDSEGCRTVRSVVDYCIGSGLLYVVDVDDFLTELRLTELGNKVLGEYHDLVETAEALDELSRRRHARLRRRLQTRGWDDVTGLDYQASVQDTNVRGVVRVLRVARTLAAQE